MPAMPDAMGDQRLGVRRLEIRTLPALLSSGADHLERALLPSTALDGPAATPGRDAVSLRGV